MLKSNPVLLREFLKEHILREWQLNFFKEPFLSNQIEKLILPLAQQVFEGPLRITHFEGIHLKEGEGVRPLKYKTKKQAYVAEICLTQTRSWPLYINTLIEYRNPGLPINDLELTSKEIAEVKLSSNSYLLNPGDIIFYNGFSCPQWRDAIEAGQYCDLAIFHFESRSLDL